MKVDTKLRHMTPADGNIFADLGFDPEEAAALKAESDRIIAEKQEKTDEWMRENPAKETDLEALESRSWSDWQERNVSDLTAR